jgi:hypothetical protein
MLAAGRRARSGSARITRIRTDFPDSVHADRVREWSMPELRVKFPKHSFFDRASDYASLFPSTGHAGSQPWKPCEPCADYENCGWMQLSWVLCQFARETGNHAEMPCAA